jgi:ABC-type multidrug transport system ATPase subunit
MALERLLQAGSADRQRTVIFSTPVPEVVETTADRVLILGDCGIQGDYTLEQIKQQAGDRRFSEALQALVFPEATQRIEKYLGKQL